MSQIADDLTDMLAAAEKEQRELEVRLDAAVVEFKGNTAERINVTGHVYGVAFGDDNEPKKKSRK